MKLNLRIAIPLLMGVVVFYAACRKTENTPAANAPASDAISATIAINLVQSLSGTYGGAGIKDGVNKSAAITAASPKLKLQTTIHCGFFIDNGLDVKFNQGDSIKTHTTGSVNYFILCDSATNSTIGYNLLDSLSSTGKGPGYDFAFLLVQEYGVRGLNLANSNFTLNGRLKSWVDFDYKAKPQTPISVHNVFHFTDIEIHAADNFDIVSGDATFESKGLTNAGAWDFQGSIHFLGNHKAKLNFLSKVYLIDLLTGAVTPV
jgi:hypothetical protein